MRAVAIVLCAVAFSAAAPAFADCPAVSTQRPDDPEERIAVERYEDSVLISGADAVIKRHGFCPSEEGLAVTLMMRDCDMDTCRSVYDVTRRYQRSDAEKTAVTGRLEIKSGLAGPLDLGVFTIGELGIGALGQSPALTTFQSECFLSGLWLAGVPVDADFGRENQLTAGRLECAKVRAATFCTFTVRDRQYELDSEDGNPILHAQLKALGGLVDDGSASGVERSAGAMLKCRRPPAPGADAVCSLFIER